jgi:AcrR family transcriptional regulator
MTGTPPTSARGKPGGLRPDDGRLERGRRSRARIRAAARELFRERGFDGATLRAIGERAGMGASSIYRHVRSKHELLVLELTDLQEEAWLAFRRSDQRSLPARERVRRFFEVQHALYAEDADLVVIALRATTYPEAPVARRALALQDRAIALLTEILQSGRRDLAAGVDPLAAGRALFHAASGARISWANGLLSEQACRRAVDEAVALLFAGIGAKPAADGAARERRGADA